MAQTHKLSKNKIYIFDHPFIKYYIFEAKVTFNPRGNPISIINYYFEHHNVTYISQSDNNGPHNRAFLERQGTNVWILGNVI